jgi:hypothetical protein
VSYATSIDNLLSASPTGNYLSIFSTFALNGTAVYNTNLWGGGGATLDWTGIIWNDDGGTGYADIANGVAITKRHVLCTNHGGHDINRNVTWIKANGATVVRHLDAAVLGIGGDDPNGFRVLYLEADLPSGIAIYPILGDSAGVVGSPVIKLDNENKALVADASVVLDYIAMVQPSGVRLQYYEDSITGDSGSPVFLLNGRQMIYASSVVTGGGGAGWYTGYYLAGILAACASLDTALTGYMPTVVQSPPTNASLHLGATLGV